MTKSLLLWGLLMLTLTGQAQSPVAPDGSGATKRQFTLNLTDDGKAQMVCFLPSRPSGKAIVGIPGGGYSMLSNSHEGMLAS